jgi:hypothetical protein
MDIYGNRELIYYNGRENVLHPLPIRPRLVPPRIPDRVVWPKEGEPPTPGSFYSPNVLEGVPEIPLGKVKYLRVIDQVHNGQALRQVPPRRRQGTAEARPHSAIRPSRA